MPKDQANLFDRLLKTDDFKIEGALLSLADIIPPDDGEEPSTEFVKSVSQWGVIQPILVERAGKKYRVRVGRRRYRAMFYCASQKQEAKDYRERVLKVDGATRDAFIPAGIVSGLPEKASADVLTLVENSMRSSNMMSECAAIVNLMEQGLGKPEVSRISGLSSAEIDQRLRLVELHPRLRELYAQGKMAQGVMMAASKLPAPLQAKLVTVADRRMRQDEEIKRALKAEDIHDVKTVRQKRALADLGQEDLFSDSLGEEAGPMAGAFTPKPDYKPRVKFHLDEALRLLREADDAETMTVTVDVESAVDELSRIMGVSELNDGNATVIGETEHTKPGLDEIRQEAEKRSSRKRKATTKTRGGKKS